MEKFLLNTKEDLDKAISFFGSKYLKQLVKKYPCILVGHYEEDWEAENDGYSFAVITENDFKKESGIVYRGGVFI